MSRNIAYGNYHLAKNQINKGTQSIGNSQMIDIPTNQPIINIHVSCKHLKKLDLGSESDPMVVLFIPINGKEVEIARTEVIWNDCNPTFVKFFQALYVFETQQPLKFYVYDVDSEKAPLHNHEFIGYINTDVQHLVSNTSTSLEYDLIHPSGKSRGKIVLTIEQASSCGLSFAAAIAVKDLKKVKTFAKNSPYIQLSKPSEAGTLLPVFRTEVVKHAYTCTFQQFEIPLQNLSGGDLQTPVTVTAMNYSEKKADKPIGSFTMSVQSIVDNKSAEHELLDSNRKKAGKVKFLNPTLLRKPTFFDYLRGGLQLNLITAIDFTASNRDPRDPRSLHFFQPNAVNQYESCIWSVGSVVCPYDSDQLFPVFGFGGKINGIVSHCFPLTFDPNQPCVQGLSGISQAYRDSLSKVVLSGPTLFAPIIKNATQVAIHSFQTSHTYTILLILTDGVINDMQETIDAIVEASDAPLSIIVIGIGTANFDGMEILDGDNKALRNSAGQIARRDIVQFVPFNRYNANNGAQLAGEVLAEIPMQVHQFCSTHGFIPPIG